jgi:putative transposase
MDSSLAHTKWNCIYHIVFIPKYRRKVMYGKIKKEAHHKIAFMVGMTWFKQHKLSLIHAAQGFSVSSILHL